MFGWLNKKDVEITRLRRQVIDLQWRLDLCEKCLQDTLRAFKDEEAYVAGMKDFMQTVLKAKIEEAPVDDPPSVVASSWIGVPPTKVNYTMIDIPRYVIASSRLRDNLLRQIDRVTTESGRENATAQAIGEACKKATEQGL